MKLKIGLLTDLSGPFRDVTGATTVACVEQAIEDFSADHPGFEVGLVVGEHKSSAQVAAGLATQWMDREAVDVILDGPSNVVEAVAGVVQARNKVYLCASAGTAVLQEGGYRGNAIKLGHDSAMLARSTGGAIVRNGGLKWFFITADYQFGIELEEETRRVVQAQGATVVGAIRYPFPGTTDFSPFIAEAARSGADVLAFANSGMDTVNGIRQAQDFGGRAQRVALLGTSTLAHALAPQTAAGLLLTETWYWDLNDRTRAFTQRIVRKTPSNWPNSVHAGAYSIVGHYLRTASRMGVESAASDGARVVAAMKASVLDDDAHQGVRFRENGRGLLPAHLFRVREPARRAHEWDLYELVHTTRPEDAAPRDSEPGR